MKLRLVALSVTLAILATFIVAPLSAGAAPKTASGTATFQGIAGTVTNLSAVTNQVTNVTTITGTFTDTLGHVTTFTTTLLGATGTCQILNLTLGPLDLNLLGVMVHLNTVVLNITAVSGAGNLLGNLLCAVAHLLDGGGPLSNLTGLLNNIFRNL
jgi:hypothetical protein